MSGRAGGVQPGAHVATLKGFFSLVDPTMISLRLTGPLRKGPAPAGLFYR